MTEAINNPPHYTAHPSGVEAIEICEHLPFNLGNAIKYLFRVGKKGSGLLDSVIEDLRKAAWYARRESERNLGFSGASTEAMWSRLWVPSAHRAQLRDEGVLGDCLRTLIRAALGYGTAGAAVELERRIEQEIARLQGQDAIETQTETEPPKAPELTVDRESFLRP